MRRIFVPFVLLFALMFAGCTYDDSELVERIEELERSNNVSTLREQVESLTKSITALETLSAKFDELSAKNGADILDLGIEFEQLHEYVEERLDRVETHTAWLEDIIDGKIEDALSGGADVDDKVAELRLWVKGTYATLDQYDALSEDMAQLESALSTIQDDLAAYKQEVEESLGDVDASIGEITEDISQMLESIESLASSITDIQGDIDELQSSMQTWVNEQLSNYYTIAQVDAELQRMEQTIADGDAALAEELVTIFVQLQQSIAEGDEALASEIDKAIAQLEQSIASGDEALASEIDSIFAQLMQSITDGDAAVAAEVKALIEQLSQSITNGDEALATELESMQDDIDAMYESLEQLRADVTSEYRSVIEEVIMENGGVIDTKIKAKIEEVNARVDAELKSLDERVDDLEQRIDALESDINGLDQRLTDIEDALDKIKALDLEFDIEDGVACMAGASIEFGYRVIGGDDDTEVESFGDGGWRTRVTATDATQGRIKVTAPKDDAEDGKIVVLATSGAGGTCMKAIYFDRGIITDIMDSYETSYMANTLAVTLKTNLEYDVEISAEAQSWISCADTRAELREDTLSFTIEENLYDEPRTAVIHLVGALGDKLQSFEIVQQKSLSNAPIQFADQNVKRVCVEKFDTNGDGELSYKEAAKVTEIGGEDPFFGDYTKDVTSFDELQYFINLKTIGDDALSGCSSLTSVAIPDSVVSIGVAAFAECFSLTSMTIPDSVTTIEDGVFYDCRNLTSVMIPDSVTTIGEYVFYNCKSIANIAIPDGVTMIGEYAFNGCSSLTSVTIGNSVTAIEDYTFSGCTSLTNVTIPNSVTEIGQSAFGGCNGLTSVTIGNNVTEIGAFAFYGCSGLTSVTIPDSVTTIGDWAFNDCGSLTSVTIPDSVTAIGDYAFQACISLKSLTIGNSVTTIGEGAFYACGSLTSVTIPDSVTTIGDYAFNWCNDIQEFKGKFAADGGRCLIKDNIIIAYANASGTEYTIPDTVAQIGTCTFISCYSLISLTIPNSVTIIGDGAFAYCDSLTSVSVPDSVTTIGERTFERCEELINITIPDSVTMIGDSAFSCCYSLEEVYFKATTPPTIGSGVFDVNATGRKIYVPAESVGAYKSAAYWSDYADAIVGYNFEDSGEVVTNNEIWYTNGSTTEATTPYSTDVFGANIVSNLYDTEKGCWVITFDGEVTMIGGDAFRYRDSLTSVTIPDSVMTIGDYAFYYCDSLTSVTIPDSVTTIGDRAFSECSSLTSVTLGDSVTTIGDYAFYGCSSLTSVTLGDSVTTIGYGAFYGCSSLTAFYGKFASEDNRCLIVDGVLNSFAPSGLTAYNIPDRVTTIGYHAFYACSNLTSVTIPDSVTMIGNYAFYFCASLTSVTIPDSVTTIGDMAFSNCYSLKTVYCKPITPPALNDAVFGLNASGRKIYVPASEDDNIINAYKSAVNWSDYADDIYEIQPSKNEIWYTNGSTTEATTPHDSNAFGDVTIQSNLYDTEKGCWVITFDGDVTTIGDWAFYYCDSLTSVTIPDGVTSIGGFAFHGCRSLTSVTIPDSVTAIGNGAFSMCSSLKEFKGKFAADGGRCLIMGNTIIAYAEASGTTYTIPNNVTTIGEYAFDYCSSLTSVTIPDSVTKIGGYAFYGCSSLTSVTIPDSVTSIGNDAFWDCDSLTSVTIPDSVTAIGNGAFSMCSSLKEFKGKFAADGGRCLIMGNTIIAYAEASGTTYTILDSVTTIGVSAFRGCSLTSVTIPDSVTTIGYSAFHGCRSLTSITIPDSVTTVGGCAFYYCDSLTSVTIPDSVTTIGYQAFCYCSSLTSVTIPDSVTTIGNGAFRECASLTSVYCKPITPPTGDSVMFGNNASGRKIYVPAESVGAYKSAAYWSDYADAIVGV